MIKKFRSLGSGAWIAASIIFVSVLPLPARAEESRPAGAAAPQTNVRVTVRLGKLEQGKRTVLKTYGLLVVAGGSGSKLLSGARVPIPTAMPAASGTAGEAGTRIVYQNIGFSVTAETWLAGDKKIGIRADIEDSRLDERGQGQLPVVETRQLSVNALVSDGVPIEVTRVEADAGATGFVEVEAEILK